jgi:predicted metal-binding membrane protein
LFGYPRGIVTDTVEPIRTTSLAAALARPKALAIICLATLTGLGWIYLALMVANAAPAGSLWAVLCRPAGAVTGTIDFILVFLMWVAMVLAMMLPTAGAMLLTYADIAETAARKGEPIVSPFVLAAGYVVVWLGFAFEAAGMQAVLARLLLVVPAGSALLSGAFFLLAGLYQFSALKHACLNKCQHPLPFFFANWTTRTGGVFRLGLRQGAYCLGCCWAMMLLMFAVGTMNIVWMAVLGIVMAAEKMATTDRLSRAVGAVLIAIGLALVVAEAASWRSV